MSNLTKIILLLFVALPVLLFCIYVLLHLFATINDRFQEDCDNITDNMPHTSVRVLK